MNILITGGAGYLGSVITPLLVNKGYDVTVYDNLMYNQLTLSDLCYKSNFKFVYGDVRDYKKLNEYVQKADVIIPLAAIVGFPACEKDKQLAEEVNYNQIYAHHHHTYLICHRVNKFSEIGNSICLSRHIPI